LGGITLLLALLLFFVFIRRRKNVHKSTKEVPVDLLQDQDDDAQGNGAHHNGLPPFYEPEPFMVPDPTIASRSSHDHGGRPLSLATTTTDWALGGRNNGRSPTPDALANSGATSTSRKTAGGPRVLRPVNVIQHDDAGPSGAPEPEEGEETIELPPAYTNIKTAAKPQAEREGAAGATTA
jgi:hypothetical protein